MPSTRCSRSTSTTLTMRSFSGNCFQGHFACRMILFRFSRSREESNTSRPWLHVVRRHHRLSTPQSATMLPMVGGAHSRGAAHRVPAPLGGTACRGILDRVVCRVGGPRWPQSQRWSGSRRRFSRPFRFGVESSRPRLQSRTPVPQVLGGRHSRHAETVEVSGELPAHVIDVSRVADHRRGSKPAKGREDWSPSPMDWVAFLPPAMVSVEPCR